ncbi:MAG: class II fructose-bisphosphate aldolase [Christensenellaceae bacterium]|jgi:fructose-bisphosphate aldolase class II|nr:class II fructose-bisphosphate aldolase [Christensenellaceae bacterium]
MFVPMKQVLDMAYAGRYGVPAVPAFNEIQVRASIEAAVEANSPLIFLTSNRGNPEFTHGIVRYFAEQAGVPVALCLDHSPSFEDCVMGIRTGCSAIMADRSTLPYEQNVEQVLILAKMAHAAGVSIEAELGHVGQGSNYAVDGVSQLTDPDEAKRFIAETGVDGLAVAIGTAHGTYSGVPKLDFERLKDIDAACGLPLVLHGGSGSGDENIHKACTLGVAKVNIVTDVLAATYQAVLDGDFKGNRGHFFYPALLEATKKCVLRLFEITGSTGKYKAGAGSLLASDKASTEEK